MTDIADQIAAMDQDEVAAWVKTFKGTCNKCDKYGNKGSDCPGQASNQGAAGGSKNNNNNGGKGKKKRKFNGKCHNCGKWGHVKADCRSLKRDQANLAQDDEGSQDLLFDCDEYARLGSQQ